MKILRLNYKMMDHIHWHFTKKKKTVRTKQQITTIWKIKSEPSAIGVWNKPPVWKDASMIFFCLISRDCGTFFWVGAAADYSNLKWRVGGNEKIIIRLHFFRKKFGKLKPFRFPGCAVPAKFVPSSSLFRYLFFPTFFSYF